MFISDVFWKVAISSEISRLTKCFQIIVLLLLLLLGVSPPKKELNLQGMNFTQCIKCSEAMEKSKIKDLNLCRLVLTSLDFEEMSWV